MTAVERAATVSTDELYERAAAGLPCWVSDEGGQRIELPMARWFGGARASAAERSADQAILAECAGTTVDLGCGPGRFTAALTARGVVALGVDSSAVAVRMTIARGALAMQRDMFGPLPGAGHWARALLADGNIGIGGTLSGCCVGRPSCCTPTAWPWWNSTLRESVSPATHCVSRQRAQSANGSTGPASESTPLRTSLPPRG